MSVYFVGDFLSFFRPLVGRTTCSRLFRRGKPGREILPVVVVVDIVVVVAAAPGWHYALSTLNKHFGRNAVNMIF